MKSLKDRNRYLVPVIESATLNPQFKPLIQKQQASAVLLSIYHRSEQQQTFGGERKKMLTCGSGCCSPPGNGDICPG